jgi:hypothetical protein
MARDLVVGDNVVLWDTTFQMEKVQVGCGCYRNPMLVFIHQASRMEYCIIISPLVMFKSMAQKIYFAQVQE